MGMAQAAAALLTARLRYPDGSPVRCVIADVSVGVLLVFAVTSLSVYGIVLAGWASNSKYPFLGGIRSSAQLISYELAMEIGRAHV